MAGLNSLRSLFTRYLCRRARATIRKVPPIGRAVKYLEDRLTPVISMSLSGSTASVLGDAAADTLRISVDTSTAGGPFLVHNRFIAGDAEFTSNLDFNSSTAGEQRLLAVAASTVNINDLGDGDDSLVIVRGTDGATGSGDVNASFGVFNLGANDGDTITVDDSTRAVFASYKYDTNKVEFTGPGYLVDLSAFHKGGFFLTTGNGLDTVDVEGTFGNSQEVSLNSAGGNDTVNITGDIVGTLVGLNSDVVIRNSPTFSVININGSTDSTARTATLDTATLPAFAGQTFGRLTTNASPGAIYYAIAGSRDVSDVNIDFGTGTTDLIIDQTSSASGAFTTDITFGGAADTVNVQAVAANAKTSLNTGAGNDLIAFASGADLRGGTVNGGADVDTLDYSAYTSPVAANLGIEVPGLTSSLDGSQEVGATASTATGTAAFNYNLFDKTFDLSLTVTDLDPADVNGLHLHRGAVGVNGPIIIDLMALGLLVPAGTGFTLNLTGVDLDNSLLGGRANEAAFLGGVTYLNIHTAAFATGEIRGQVFSTGNVNTAAIGTATGAGGVSFVENVIGGSAEDGLIGSFAANVLTGNGGSDILLGGPGADTFAGNAGDDIMIWSNGDGSDVMDGGTDNDLVQVNGSLNPATPDVFDIAAGTGGNTGRIDFDRLSPGPFNLDIGTTETLNVNGIVGDESFTVNDLTGVAALTRIRLNGLAGNDTFNIIGYPPTAISVSVIGGAPTKAPGDTLNFAAGGDNAFKGVASISNGTSSISFTQIENVDITNASPPLPDVIAASGQPNGTSLQFDTIVDGEYDPIPVATLAAFGNVAANIRAATADVDGDGIQDTVLVTGPGTPIRVAVVSGVDDVTLLVQPFDPFGGDFLGGGFVAATDLVGDGRAEFVITPDEGGGPRVSIFSLLPNGTVATFANFLGIDDDAFRGGARPALGDVDGDGFPDLLVAAGFGGGPRVALFDGGTLFTTRTKLVGDFFAFPDDASTLRNGIFAALGDIDGDGFADLVFGGGPGGAPRVYILSGEFLMSGNANLFSQPIANFFVAGNANDRGGVRLAVKNADGDAQADLAVGSGEGSPAKVRVYLGSNFTGTGEPSLFQDLDVFGGATLAGGVFVG